MAITFLCSDNEENTKEYPVVICKLKGRGYSVCDTARDTIYSVSEIKLKKPFTIILGDDKYKGVALFANREKEGNSFQGKLKIKTKKGIIKKRLDIGEVIFLYL